MSSIWILAGALGVFALAYRYYSAFLAARVLMVDPKRETPAHRLHDGRDYVPTNRWVLFGHHFAAISGAGPLLGPVLATQFGYAPGALWIIFGAVLAGAVHDFVTLFASVRHDGKSLSFIARQNINRLSGAVASLAVLFIIVTALAGLAIAVVKALAASPWGTFTIAATIPAALLVGLYLHVLRPGRVVEASALAVGMADIFSKLPGMKSLLAYWYHYVVMFEALFILTAVDTGTRVARFIVQEAFFGKVAPGAARSKAVSWVVTVVASAIACLAWGYLLYHNDISTIWPMFGVANQLLAAVALAIGTTLILRTNRARYALVTFLPLCFVLVTTLDAGWQNMMGYLAKGTAQDHLNLALTAAMTVMVIVITADAGRAWLRLLREKRSQPAEQPIEA